VMLWIAVEGAGTVCDGDYSIFFWTVDRLPPPIADHSLPLQVDRTRIACCASTRWRSVAVVNPLHAGDAYVSREMTTARKTACRPFSVMSWRRSTRRAYSVFALSLITRRIWSEADRWFVIVTPRIFSTFSRDISGSGRRYVVRDTSTMVVHSVILARSCECRWYETVQIKSNRNASHHSCYRHTAAEFGLAGAVDFGH